MEIYLEKDELILLYSYAIKMFDQENIRFPGSFETNKIVIDADKVSIVRKMLETLSIHPIVNVNPEYYNIAL